MRVPLHYKLVVSYLVVVGLVLVPTAVYLQTTLRRGHRETVRAELRDEVRSLTQRLDATPAAQRDERMELLCSAVPLRITIVEPSGRVFCDSQRAALGNHGDREEIRDAFERGEGTSVRRSATTGEVTLYVAHVFHDGGAVAGVVRLARPLASVEFASDQVSAVMRQTGAVALTVAVLLSLFAAVVASRPLRRMALAARAFSEGDFAAELPKPSEDEIGDVAEALGHLAAQLRGRLLASGADRSTLFALLDDLPVGVVLYGAERHALRINAAARAALDLHPHDEDQRCAEIPALPSMRESADAVMADGFTRQARLSVPWSPTTCDVRWVAVYGADGARSLALVIIDAGVSAERDDARQALAECVTVLRRVAANGDAGDDARSAARCADAVERRLPLLEPDPANAVVVSARDLVNAAHEAALAGAAEARIDVSGEADVEDVVDVDGRGRRAVVALLRWALGAHVAGAVHLRVSSVHGAVRFAVRGAAEADGPGATLGSLVGPIGGAVGEVVHDAEVERWIDLPAA